ncbi:hypothetical protein C8Q78DRAFT_1079979 [Trametes maxima]|nr:hypothetical protein C8Q78DRAFT_1079979 [Trametes maxima]
MRSPVLTFSFLAAAATVSVAAQASHLAQGAPLAPRLQAKAESFRLGSREYPTTAHSRPEDIAKNSREPDRPQNGAQRAGHPEPPRVQTAHGADTGIRLPSGSGLDGGVSGTAPAVGSDAGQRGGSARSPDSPPALGQDAINIGENATSRIMAAAEEDSPAPPNGNYTGASEHYRSGYTRMRRMYRHVNTHSASKYADPLSGSDGESTGLALTEQELTTDDSGSSDDGSGNDGADGTITKGIARPGSGLDGGHAETGEPGSSKGGHVYNSPGAQ